MSVAVITGAVSATHYLPHWHRYYGRLFGTENLFVVAYNGAADALRQFDLGLIIEQDGPFNEAIRVINMRNIVEVLLRRYDRVIHCDVDEFLIPDPAQYVSLADYVEKLDTPHVAAVGMNVVEVEVDDALDMTAPLMRQRSRCYPESGYCKTCIVDRPVTWSPGFHNTDLRPNLAGDLFLFHMKFANFKSRSEWLKRMVANCASESYERKMLQKFLDDLDDHRKQIWRFPQAEWTHFDFRDFEQRLQNAILEPLPGDPCYRQTWFRDPVLFAIPDEFRKAL